MFRFIFSSPVEDQWRGNGTRYVQADTPSPVPRCRNVQSVPSPSLARNIPDTAFQVSYVLCDYDKQASSEFASVVQV
jgi:hypothetical protein